MIGSLDGDGASRENTDYTIFSRENTMLSGEGTWTPSWEIAQLSRESTLQFSRENTDINDGTPSLIPAEYALANPKAWQQSRLPLPPPPASTAPNLAPAPQPPPPPVTPPRAPGNCGKNEKKIWDMYALGSVQLPTVGSVGHYSRKCKPCVFVHTKGCTSGTECQFCHLCEPGEKRRRQQGMLEKRKRQQQQRCRRSQGARNEQERLEQGNVPDFEDGHAALPLASRAARIAAPGGGSSSRDDEQWLSI
jgi:type IV secretory pathway VirB10-like protein